MNQHGKPNRQQRDFNRAMADSANLPDDLFSETEPPQTTDDFLTYELGRLLEEEEQPSFENDEFRFLIQQGIRLEWDRDIDLRSRLVAELRKPRSQLGDKARRILPHLIGAIEDTDFPLDRIGAIVRYYTSQLFARLETRGSPEPDPELGETIERWRTGAVNRETLIAAIQKAEPNSIPLVADLLFEAADDTTIASTLIGILARPSSVRPGSEAGIRALAYAISEPFLDESLERQASEALAATWPAARSYLLYNLRKHTHEDIPFRWMELLVSSGELRAVDRILEEVLRHAHIPDYREDLLAALDLIDRSQDPGREGKVLRLLEGPGVPPGVRSLLVEWAGASPCAGFMGERNSDPLKPAEFVHLGEDFSAFVTRHADSSMQNLCARWDAAYHESMGWIQRSKLPRGNVELQFEADIEKTLIEQISPGRRPDEGTIRGMVESIRELKAAAGTDGPSLLVDIHRSRPRDNPWLADIFLRELNGLYVRAAESYDSGDAKRARTELDIVLEIEPEYPLAVMLNTVMAAQVS